MSNFFDKLKFSDLKHVYNYFQILYNILIYLPPRNVLSYNSLNILWNKKIQPIKDIFRNKNAIYNIIINIKNILNNIFNPNNIIINDIQTTIVSEKEKEENNNSKLKEKKGVDNSFNISLTMDYKAQLALEYFKYEDDFEGINIFYKNDKIQYISIDLLIKKLCEDNSFNKEIFINHEKNQTFNLINAFIFQCFGFIKYEILINKLLCAHRYYTKQNKLNPKINNRIIHLIFKITKYLWDHEIYKRSYFQSSEELTNNLRKFLNNNNMKEQIKPLLDYKKGNMNILDINNEEKKDQEISKINYMNVTKGGFEFNILKYDSKDIALIITYISLKNFKNLYNHLYELNPTIKKDEADKPYLSAIVNFSNKLTNFFIEEVFSYDLLNDRVNIVVKIINILIELKNMNNFNDIVSVYSALFSISIRLNKTWNQIDSKMKAKLDSFKNLCSPQECYKNIKEEQLKCFEQNKFYIPLMNITTKHINFYDESCKYINKNGLICIEKIIINQNEIEAFKNEIRPLTRKNKIAKQIKSKAELKELKIIFNNMNPKDLYALEKISEKLEPKFTLYNSPDNRKRKTKTDLFINSNYF